MNATPAAIPEIAPLPASLPRVLIVMTDHHMGNLLISLPVINALAAYFGEPPDLLVDARYAPLAALLPAALRVVAYPEQTGKRRGLWRNLKPAAMTLAMPFKRYRAVLDLGGGARSAFISVATLSRRRFGFADMPRSGLYSRKVVRERGIHVFDAYCEMLRVIGQKGRPPLVRLQAPPAAHEAVQARLRAAQPEFGAPLAIIHPGAGKEYRQWPAQRFAAVADELVRRHRMNVCVIGAAGEAELMRTVIESMTLAGKGFPLSLPLIELLALCERASILLSNESGPTHLAAATDLPIVTIFGPSNEAIWRPIREEGTIVLRGAQCDPRCGKRKCYADRRCLMSLGTGQVLEAVEAVLAWRADVGSAHQRANDTVETKS